MNEKQKELLENIQLKTIEKMIDNKNINVLAVIKESRDKDLFFDEFYEIIFTKMIAQFDIKDFVSISTRYDNFKISPLKASILMNEAIKYAGSEFTSYCNFQNIDYVMNALHNNNLFFDSMNMNRLQSSINVSKNKAENIEKNIKIKEYLELDERLEEKGITSKKPKI